MNGDVPARTAARYDALDALRAAMMLLGLVLHSAASYTHSSLGEAWPYQDSRTSPLFDVIVFLIHVFRMPTFFVVAGFFGALLYRRGGAAGFARNRSRRVLIPLVVFWPAVVPSVGLGLLFALEQGGTSRDWQLNIAAQPILQQPVLGHLWFLYHLLLLYVGALAVLVLLSRVPDRVRRRLNDGFRSIVADVRGLVVLATLTTFTLLPMEAPGIETSATLIPAVRVLAAYSVFFAFGWVLFGYTDLLPVFGRLWRRRLASGVCTATLYLVGVAARPIDDTLFWHIVCVGLASVSTWLLIFGIVGLFVRYMDSPNPLARYLSDASYWIYLVHLAPVVWTAGVLARMDAPAVVKFAIVLSATTAVATVTYHYFVRSTGVGVLLNGRRYPRTPSETPRAAAASQRTG